MFTESIKAFLLMQLSQNSLVQCPVYQKLAAIFNGVEQFFINPDDHPDVQIMAICHQLNLERLDLVAYHQLGELIDKLSSLRLFYYSFVGPTERWSPMNNSFTEFHSTESAIAAAEHPSYQYDRVEIKSWLYRMCTLNQYKFNSSDALH